MTNPIGGVWFTENEKLRIEIDDGKDKSTYEVEVNATKTTDKHPDYRSEDVAVWKRQTKTGKPMLSMSINGDNLVAFHNDYKQDLNDPEYNIMPRFER